MRYKRQPHKSYVCGPVAVYNTLLYKYGKSDYSVRDLSNMLHCKSISGTATYRIRKFFRQNFVYVRKLKQLDKYIDAGHALLLNYDNEHGGHYILIDKRTKDGYNCINDSTLKTVKKRKRKTISKYLKCHIRQKAKVLVIKQWKVARV